MMDRNTRYLFMILGLGLLLRLVLAAVYPVTGDACSHELSVRQLQWEGGFLPEEVGGIPVWWPYFYHGILAILTYPFASSGIFSLLLMLANALMGTLSIFLVYKIVHLYSKDGRIALISAAFIAVFPIHVFYSAVFYTDVPMTTFILLFIYFALQERPVLAGLSGAAAILTKFNGVIIFPFLLAIYMFKKSRFTPSWYRQLFTIGMVALIVGSPFLVRNMMQFGNPFSMGDQGTFGGSSRESVPLGDMLSKQYVTFFGEPSGHLFDSLKNLPVPRMLQLIIGVLWILLTIAVLAPALKGAMNKNWRRYALMTSLMGITLFLHIIVMSILLKEETHGRYSMIALLPLSFFFALGFKETFMRLQKLTYAPYIYTGAAIVLFLTFIAPFFIQAHISEKIFSAREPVYKALRGLPPGSMVYGFEMCAEDHAAIPFRHVSFIPDDELFEEGTKYILISPTIRPYLEREGIYEKVLATYVPYANAGDLILLRKD